MFHDQYTNGLAAYVQVRFKCVYAIICDDKQYEDYVTSLLYYLTLQGSAETGM